MDRKALDLGLARLEAFRSNLPFNIDQATVDSYHEIVDSIALITGDDLNQFKVPPTDMKPKVLGARRAPYGGGRGSVHYSKEKYCEDALFGRCIDGLAHFLTSQDYKLPTTPRPTIRRESSHHTIHVENMYNSAIQQGTDRSTISVAFDAKSEEFKKFITLLRASVATLPISDEGKGQLRSDLDTIEAQIHAPVPKKAIIAECGTSIRAITEGVIGSLVATGLWDLIVQYFPKH